nr:unnamed protein product [Digitaria exilis]
MSRPSSFVLDALPNNDVGSRVVIINTLEDNGVALAVLSPSWLRVHRLEKDDSRSMFLRNACGNEQDHKNKHCGSTKWSKDQYNRDIDAAVNDMWDITKGLHLAILLLGRLLRRKEFPIQWTDVLMHLKNMNKRTSRLEGILALSFDDLPHYLKSCFLHFAMMPENSIQIARRLVRLWAAEGFLKPNKGESMEDIGDRYLKELVSRGMVRLVGNPSKGDISPLVTVHRRLHAMARFEAQEATFLDVYDKAHVPSTTSIRHLFLQNFRDAYVHHMGTSFPNLRSFVCEFADGDEGENKQNDEEPQHGAGGGINNNQSNHHKCLCLPWTSSGGINSDQCNHNHCFSFPWRSKGGINSDQCNNNHCLSLPRRSNGGINSDQRNHNHCLSLPWRSNGGINSDQCNHNHCLSIPWRSNGGINSDKHNHSHCHSLPRRSNGGINNDEHKHNHFLSILRRSKLIRVIDLKGLQVTKVPPDFGNFIHLRYLAIRSRGLKELPITIANLINLQTLDIRGCKVKKLTQKFWMISTLQYILADNLLLPKSVGKLKNMQGLIGMNCVHQWRNNITPLDNMVNLRHLHIFGLTPDHFRVLSEALVKLESLEYLNLGGSREASIPLILFTGFLLRRLQSLKLCGRIDMTGDKEDKRCTLPNLTRLELVDSMVNQGFINKIGKLPCLTELVLSEGSYGDAALSFSGGEFANLTNLILRGLSQVSEWNIRAKSSLPRVQQITVSGCTKMKLKIEGQHEALKKIVWEFTVIDMPDNWPWVEGSTGLDERLKRVIVRRKGPKRRGS